MSSSATSIYADKPSSKICQGVHIYINILLTILPEMTLIQCVTFYQTSGFVALCQLSAHFGVSEDQLDHRVRLEHHLNLSLDPVANCGTDSMSVQKPAVGMASPLVDALQQLLCSLNRLRSMTGASPRESVAVSGILLDQLRTEFATLDCRRKHSETDREATSALASDEIGALTTAVRQLARQRFRVLNWLAQVAILWLKLRALALILFPIAPEIARELAYTLTGRSPALPQLEGISGVHLVPFPVDLIIGRKSVDPTPAMVRAAQEQPTGEER